MEQTSKLSQETIRLRAPEPEDLEVMLSFENEAELWELGTATGPYSRYQMKRYIAENQNDVFVDGQLRLMIVCNTGEVGGMIDIFSFDARHSRAEVGLVVRKDLRGKGIGGMALTLLESHCFGLLGLHQLYAYIPVGNTASRKLFAAAGYTEYGVLKDWIRVGNSFQDVCLCQKINQL
ncbi:GNAT family N-acetyltransferase [Bacteroides mediterraneensis]|uniref:GNAT family N-acetyltransferase n=1 Tax=Bacteroides mediterraneensis TaxID=1841856 RepID=A0ABS2EYC2_9BACE|nr:GNAT family protein [Bacteroides mediterraneensis]MBM6759573.1 GNAT family N-acetyltransferase [Bacteroides mediterraneensis]MBM6782222.1 GNAT family N-acetyltransferase [Bacteroides mediterraneensis]